MIRPLLFATIAAGLILGSAAAEDMAGMPAMHDGTAVSILPAACLAASAEMPMTPMPDDGADLDPVQKANEAAMQVMDGPMMQAATIRDADLAFNCGMIAHHAGAIAMAKVELAMGTDAASRPWRRRSSPPRKRRLPR